MLVVLGVLTVLCLFVQHRRHARAVARSRATSYSPEVVARVGGEVETRGLEYPLLHGTWNGHRMRAELVPDSLGFRTVPTLWLVVHVAGPIEWVEDPVTILARGTGQEIFVPRHAGYRRVRSDQVPAELMVAGPGDHPGSQRAGAVAARIAPLFDDGRLKLIDVARSGLRVVLRAHQADPTTYRVTRAADFSNVSVGEETWTVLDGVLDNLFQTTETEKRQW